MKLENNGASKTEGEKQVLVKKALSRPDGTNYRYKLSSHAPTNNFILHDIECNTNPMPMTPLNMFESRCEFMKRFKCV